MSDLPQLSAEEQRVLGSLMEKQRTVPASYPLTLNALRSACNQASSRDPVVEYDEQTVEATARGLKMRDLLRIVWADTGRRTLKYHQTLDEQLSLQPDERTLIAVLLLRGAQAPGQLKTRTERMYDFADREAVEAVLRRMAALPTPLVWELERRPGQHDHRWVHLLGPVETDEARPEPAASALDRDVLLDGGGGARDARVRASYAAVATAYGDEFVDELDDLPFEGWLLDRVAAHPGPVVEVGCGPGHVTAYLARAGADSTGLDLTPEMVAEARRRFPGGRYEVGDLRQLMRPQTSPGWGAVLAWYSLIHLAASELPGAIEALARPMSPGGLLVLALHAGAEVRHVEEWFGQPVDLHGVRHDPAEVRAAAAAAGLVEEEWYLRGPLPGRAETTERFYLLARKPG